MLHGVRATGTDGRRSIGSRLGPLLRFNLGVVDVARCEHHVWPALRCGALRGMSPRVSAAGRMRNVKAGNVPCQGWAPIAEVAELGLGKPAQVLIGDGGAIIGAAGGIPGFDPGAKPTAPASRAAAGANLDRGHAWVLAGHRSSLPALPRAIELKTTAPAVVAPAAAAAPRPLTDRRRQTPVRVP